MPTRSLESSTPRLARFFALLFPPNCISRRRRIIIDVIRSASPFSFYVNVDIRLQAEDEVVEAERKLKEMEQQVEKAKAQVAAAREQQ